MQAQDSIAHSASLAQAIAEAVNPVFVGSPESVEYLTVGLMSGLHVLIEDIPGVGKTTLALALARAAGLSFSRIQFTPDLLPGDVLGMNIWEAGTRQFVWREGPIQAQFILADELNRASPRTQAAFLEAMQDGNITVDGETRALPEPFFLVGTQNPASFAGTFPLPEAELDRFGISFSIGYPSEIDERSILSGLHGDRPDQSAALNDIKAVCSAQDIMTTRKLVRRVHVCEAVRDWIVSLVRSSRQSPDIRLGASPRAALALQAAARGKAAISGRESVMPEDVIAMAPVVLGHRIQLSSKARLSGLNAQECIRRLCEALPKPTGL